MKQSILSSSCKKLLCLAAAALMFCTFLAGCAPKPGTEPATEAPAEETAAPTAAPEATAEPKATSEPPMGYIREEEVRFNCFLTAIVQQDIENTETDLDEDAERVRFVFGYLRHYERESVIERENADGVVCRTITPEQVNAVLEEYFGVTLTPDGEDYSILDDEGKGFRCVYRDGLFWNVPPYPEQRFDFPLRFALVTKIKDDSNTLYFRLYRINPDIWGVGEAERHVPIMPMLSIYEAENGNEETKNWIIKIGEGRAVMTGFGDDMRLVKLTSKMF